MESIKMTKRTAELIRRRGYDPHAFEVIRELYGSVWIRNKNTGAVKILDKKN